MGRILNEHDTDVLIIGGGGAGARAAMEAAKYGVGVTLVDKGVFGRSGSTPCSGGYAVAFGGPGSPEFDGLVGNVIAVGEELSDRNLVEAIVGDSAKRLEELVEIGFQLEREEGQLVKSVILGHARPQVVYFDYRFCDPQAILRREVLHRGVRVMERTMVTGLLLSDGVVGGAVALDDQGNVWVVRAKAVVLAAGSATRLYPAASASFTTTGDSICLAYHAGLPLVDLEFTEMTLIPTYKGMVLGSGGGGGISSMEVYNRLGERFMEKYDPRLERAPRHVVVRAVYSELLAGNGPFRCVATGKVSRRGMHSVYLRKRLAAGLDWLNQEFYWGIALHRLLGGVRIDESGATGVEGLFAAGEASGGVHGAARLPGMALAENNTIGCRAGRAAALYSLRVRRSPRPSAEEEIERLRSWQEEGNDAAPTAHEVTSRIQEVMWTRVGVVREEQGLQQAVHELERIEAAFPRDLSGNLKQRLEVRSLALTGRLIALAALTRTESRGNHYRRDYPTRDDGAWVRHVQVRKGADGPVAELVRVGR